MLALIAHILKLESILVGSAAALVEKLLNFVKNVLPFLYLVFVLSILVRFLKSGYFMFCVLKLFL